MIEKVCNLWDEPADAKCITTNGYIKKNGALVMGAGVAGQAQAMFPTLPYLFGDIIQKHGNNVFGIYSPNPSKQDCSLIAFPVKHNWYEEADILLIKQSAEQLMSLLGNGMGATFKKVLLPRPGCGNGKLDWQNVKAVIAPILDDRVVVIDNSLESMLGETS